MKKLALLTLVISLVFTSCKKDSLVDVKFNTTLSATSDNISVNTTILNKNYVSNPADYETIFTLDLSNDDTQEYLNRLKDIDLSEIKLQLNGLSGLSGNQTPTQFKITINNQIEFVINNFIYDSYAQGDPIMALNDPVYESKIEQVTQLLLNNKEITVRVEGSIPDTNPYTFNISFLAKAKITAKAL